MGRGEICLTFDSSIAQDSPYTIINEQAKLRRGAGIYGNGYFLDGEKNTRLQIQNIPQKNDLSIGFWVNMDTTLRDTQYLISKGTGRSLYTNNSQGKLFFNAQGSDYEIDAI
jgi:hypothetical protein